MTNCRNDVILITNLKVTVHGSVQLHIKTVLSLIGGKNIWVSLFI